MQEGRGIGLTNKIISYDFQQNKNKNPFLQSVFDISSYYDKLDTVDSNLVLGFNDDHRNFEPVRSILNFFNVKKINLVTNNPLKIAETERLGFVVNKTINFDSPINQHNASYIKVKQKRMGHRTSLHNTDDKTS